MTVKELCDHCVQTDEDYQIKSSDKTILVVAPPGGGVSAIRLRLPSCVHRCHEVTVVAVDVDVTVFAPAEES